MSTTADDFGHYAEPDEITVQHGGAWAYSIGNAGDEELAYLGVTSSAHEDRHHSGITLTRAELAQLLKHLIGLLALMQEPQLAATGTKEN